MEFPTRTHYEILGVEPGVSSEQLELAYRFTLSLYNEAALATYSLLEPQEASEMRMKVEEAYQILKDPRLRHEYDAALHQGTLSAVPCAVTPTPSPREEPSLPATPRPSQQVLPDPVTGADLKRFRQSRGVRLQDIAAASKIGVRFLEYIEADRHGDLPAPVYLRSFLHEYARAVGLEPRRTAESYMARLPRDS